MARHTKHYSGQKPGSRLTRLLSNKSINTLIYKHKSPYQFFPKKRRYQGRIIAGFNAEMLVDICEGMLEARILDKKTQPKCPEKSILKM